MTLQGALKIESASAKSTRVFMRRWWPAGLWARVEKVGCVEKTCVPRHGHGSPRPGRFPSVTDAFVELAAEPIDQRLEVIPLPEVRTRRVGRKIVQDTPGVASIPGPLQRSGEQCSA